MVNEVKLQFLDNTLKVYDLDTLVHDNGYFKAYKNFSEASAGFNSDDGVIKLENVTREYFECLQDLNRDKVIDNGWDIFEIIDQAIYFQASWINELENGKGILLIPKEMVRKLVKFSSESESVEKVRKKVILDLFRRHVKLVDFGIKEKGWNTWPVDT